jgi:hypothetical protein
VANSLAEVTGASSAPAAIEHLHEFLLPAELGLSRTTSLVVAIDGKGGRQGLAGYRPRPAPTRKADHADDT